MFLDITCSSTCLTVTPLAIIPPLLWLAFFYTQDKHREKIGNIIRIFLWGMFIAIPVALTEITLSCFFEECSTSSPNLFAKARPLFFTVNPMVFSFLGIAFVEEIGKYFIVRIKALKKPFFNEPKDAMLYMISAALGFAAIENIFYALAQFSGQGADTSAVIQIIVARGLTANVLHVIASAALGYFLALALANPAERKKFLYTGIALATLLHGLFNNFIIRILEQVAEERTSAALFETVLLVSFLLGISAIILAAFYTLARRSLK